ncbi:AsmA family protein [Pseudoalteromonas rubra]|uniref:AsmA family protein n=1 Tax=Pseudoalteromonas rubra TaxID=43658 RepID=A0A5S3WQJ0_9GAMM|nr:AsmA family protein [Pseudoalteromonas rubra]TMP30919.1 AsmA family protein [Pseudoalteromonas rubra]TMP37131.1 AsmA family protein [Pseudoalteromonas rubra]
MKRVLKLIGALVLLLLVAVVVAPMLIPTSTIIAQLEQQVEANTGRKLAIAGDSELSILPRLNITLNDVRFENMPGGSQPDMLTMEQLAVHIPWVSLFSGEFKLEQFVIRNPKILLEKNTAGQANWVLALGKGTTPAQPTEQTPTSSGPVTLPAGFDIALGEVAIYGGELIYADETSGARHTLSDLALTITLPSLYQALELDGKVTFQEESFALNMTVDTPAKAIESKDFSFSQALESRLVNMTFDGQIVQQGKVFSGALKLSGDSVKEIAQWQKVDLNAKPEAFNQFEVAGEMRFANDVFALQSLKAKLDKLDIQGRSEIKLGDRLGVTADVDLGMLDLNPYLPEPVEASEQPDSVPGEPQPIVWDDSEIDLSALNMLDAKVVIRSSGLRAREIKLGANQFSVALNKGKAKLSMDKFAAYEGNGKGVVHVNAATKPYQITTNFALNNINAEPLLTDAIGFDKVLGKGSLNWDLETRGISQKQFVSALAGELAFEFKDGGVKGANLAEMVRKGKEMLKGNFSAVSEGINADFDPNQKTDFSALTGSFQFLNGVGRNRDLTLASPLIRITGEGEVDLPKTYVNYRVVTGIVDTIEGQQSQDDSTGFKVPVRIKGPFHKVETKLDLSSAAKDKAKDAVKDKLKDKLKGFFGG